MTLRIEFQRSRSEMFPRVLSIVREIPTYKERVLDGIQLYSVEFEKKDYESARAVMDFARTWKGIACYMDGKLITRATTIMTLYDDHINEMNRERSLASRFGNCPADFIRIQKRYPPPETNN